MRRLPELWVVSVGFFLNAIWELAHSALYTDHDNGLTHVIWTRLHCTVGDVLILLASFWGTSVLLWSRRWPTIRPVAGGVLFTLMGFAYTMWSEVYNTGIRPTWEYAPAMPTIFGIGLTPILQWLVLPPLITFVLARKLDGCCTNVHP